MLTRRATAYSSSCSQVSVSIHFVAIHPFAAKNFQKKLLKTNIFRVQGHVRSSMLTFLRSSSLVLVMISSMSVHICNYQACRGYEISHPYPYPCPQIFRGYIMDMDPQTPNLRTCSSQFLQNTAV